MSHSFGVGDGERNRIGPRRIVTNKYGASDV